MPRTTVDIDASVLRQVKRLARTQGKSITQVVSELLAAALEEHERPVPPRKLTWRAKAMRARVDLEDKDAVRAALDRE